MDVNARADTGYFLSTDITILIFVRIGALYGRKPLMIFSMVLVFLGSVFGGLSQLMEQLTAYRVLQGLSVGMIIANTIAIPTYLFPNSSRRAR